MRLLGDGPSPKNIERLDMGAMPMICSMAENGLIVDLSHFASMEVALVQDMERITEEVRSLTGYYCNLDSGDQVADLLFKKLKLKQARQKMTKSGDRESVEDEVLTAIQHDHPVIPKILEFKEFSKLKGTYVTPMPRLAKRSAFGEWRMYPNFNTTRVPSGRLSCKDPNLLAMPTRTERGREIRKGFIAKPGWVYLSIDESQIEVRIAAHRSQDENLMSVYLNDEDVYSDFAITAFSLPDSRFKNPGGKWEYPTVDKDDNRRPAKTCVLAAIYDVTAAGLLEQLPVVCAGCRLEATKHNCGRFTPLWTETKAQNLINSFYTRYPGLLRMRKADHAKCRSKGYIWDDWGRILHTAAARSVHEWVVSAALREAANFPIQATAQGTVKLVMAQVFDDLESSIGENCNFLLQVHDELLIECREELAEEIGELVSYRFENCVELSVPIKTGRAKAYTWGDLPK